MPLKGRPTKPTDTNSQGGFDPQPKEVNVFKKADLITLPEGVEGTNCFNCMYIRNKKEDIGFCGNLDVKQWVNNRMCCKWWDNKGVKRDWGKQI